MSLPPTPWPTKRLRFATRRLPPNEWRRAQAQLQEVTFLPMAAIGAQGELDASNLRHIQDVQSGYTQFSDGDVVVAKITPCFENGKGALVSGLLGGVGFGTTELHVLTPGPCLDGQFLYFITASAPFRSLGEAHMTGSAGQKRVPGEFLRNYRVPVPPMEEQRSIGEYLNRETGRLDTLLTEKRRVLALLAERRRTLITNAVTCGLEPDLPSRNSGIAWPRRVPEHWEVTRLKSVARVRSGIALGKRFRDTRLDEYPYLRVANVQDGYLDLTDVKSTLVPVEEALKCRLREGDVLMNEGGDADKLGRGTIWTGQIDPCLHQNHVFAVRPLRVSSSWLNVWIASDVAKAHFQSRAKQSTNLASISTSNLREMPLFKPPREEQITIADYVARKTDEIDSVSAATRRTIGLLKERRSALIAGAVTGKTLGKNAA